MKGIGKKNSGGGSNGKKVRKIAKKTKNSTIKPVSVPCGYDSSLLPAADAHDEGVLDNFFQTI